MRFADPFARKTQRAALSIAAAVVAVTMGADARGAEESSTTLSPGALHEIAQLEAEIDRIEARTIERGRSSGLLRRRTIRSSKSSCSVS